MALSEALLALAATAGSGLVSAATTDAWVSIKDGFAQIFGGGDGPQRAVIEGRLEATRTALEHAAPEQAEHVRTREEQTWQVRLTDLVEERPDVAPDLQRLVDVLASYTPGNATGERALAVGGNINNEASSGGVAAGVINGAVSTSNPQTPGRL
jgi:hypothetical protein